MGETKSMTIYLGGPIDDISDADAYGWRIEIGRHCPTGCLFFDPAGAYYGAGLGTAREVDHMNRVALVHCDGLLVNLGGPGRGFGSIREIEFARMHGKPVAVATGGTPIVSLTAHDLLTAETVDEALMLLIAAVREHQDAPKGMMIQLPSIWATPPQEGEDGEDE